MKRLINLPLAFLFVAACIGLALRWHQWAPVLGFNYGNWLHAHSHVMFLGWVFNALTIAFVVSFIEELAQKRYYGILIAVNIALIGMVVLFPLMGYRAATIILSAIHTGLVFIYCVFFFRDTHAYRNRQSVSFARISLMFFVISAVGPMALAIITSNGLGHTHGYRYAVYYYLHFQYNGTFTFGVFSLLFGLVETKEIQVDWKKVKWFKWVLAYACVPAYVLSILWNRPGLVFNLIGFVAAGLQLLALALLGTAIGRSISEIGRKLTPVSRWLLAIAYLAFGIKLVLQFISAHPATAVLADQVRYFTIAYLHLVLIGMISFTLLAWYQETQPQPLLKVPHVAMIAGGFIASELSMISVGWLAMDTVLKLLVGSSAIVVGGLGFSIINHAVAQFNSFRSTSSDAQR